MDVIEEVVEQRDPDDLAADVAADGAIGDEDESDPARSASPPSRKAVPSGQWTRLPRLSSQTSAEAPGRRRSQV
jgi:hypothetical protein